MNEFSQNAKEMKAKASTLYDTAKENAESAYYSTKPKAEDLLNKVSETASDLYESGKETATDLYETGKETLIQANGYIEDSVTYASESIRKQPLISVCLAAGIGYLFAKLIK